MKVPFRYISLLVGSCLAVILGMSATTLWFAQPETGSSFTNAVYTTDVSDIRKLAGIAENIFVGRVLAYESTHYPDGIPETLFTVEVEENIKGNLQGKIQVNQQGGSWPVSDSSTPAQLNLVNNDALLVPGSTYLFATLPHADGRWHTLIPVYGDILIADSAQKESIAQQYQQAVDQQIPYEYMDVESSSLNE